MSGNYFLASKEFFIPALIVNTGRKWKGKKVPKRVLFIRLQALGDTVITMPYVKGFAQAYPETEIYFLTRKEVAGVPKSFPHFKRVWSIGGGRNSKLTFILGLLLVPSLFVKRFDIVYDLQNNRETNIFRRLLLPRAWVGFDRFSPVPSGERVEATIKFVGLDNFKPDYSSNLRLDSSLESKFPGLKTEDLKVVVNPAGFHESRNWPNEYYFDWAEKMIKAYDSNVSFILIGVDRVEDFAVKFEQRFPKTTLNLVNQTSVMEAYTIIQNTDFVLSEDSGLMHMAWTSGIPTLAIFGSSRSDWSRPLGPHSKLLGSHDMACGNCMEALCQFGDNRCLTRYSPEFVFSETQKLINV